MRKTEIMKKVVACWICLSLSICAVLAQNFDIYDNYFSNRYLINPAEAATDYAMVHLNYRKQWLGFNGAPAISSFTYTSRFNNSRSGVGAKVSSVTAGITQETEAVLTYVHGIGLNDHQTLSFALSAGGKSLAIDDSKLNINDPALNDYMANNLRPSANFGMLFHCNSGLNLGITLPELFTKSIKYSEHDSPTTPMPWNEVIFTGYFSRDVSERIATKKKNGVAGRMKSNAQKAPLELFFLYRYIENEVGQAEGLLKINLSEKVAVAGGYRQWLGPIGSVYFDFQKLLLSYSYEPVNKLADFSSSSHEIQLGLKLGKEKTKLKKRTPQLRSTLKTKSNEQHVARFQQETEDDLHNQNKPDVKKHYVVIKSFKEFDQADEYKQKLISQKYNGNVVYNEADGLYHVYVFETTRAGDAHSEARNIKNFTKLKQAKVIVITHKK
jgi:type IX secretion system PorP/SprF family membrane protein